ncbi:hypothetical protein BC831DRAFT_457002, partial [Entophlyctis helioformis]
KNSQTPDGTGGVQGAEVGWLVWLGKTRAAVRAGWSANAASACGTQMLAMAGSGCSWPSLHDLADSDIRNWLLVQLMRL